MDVPRAQGPVLGYLSSGLPHKSQRFDKHFKKKLFIFFSEFSLKYSRIGKYVFNISDRFSFCKVMDRVFGRSPSLF